MSSGLSQGALWSGYLSFSFMVSSNGQVFLPEVKERIPLLISCQKSAGISGSITGGKINLTKSGKVRKVDVSDALLAALLDLRRNRKEALLAQGKNELPATAWIFENEEGGFQDMKNLKKRHFQKCLGKAGLRRIRFHECRHTFASLLIQNGESLTYVKEQLGHSSIKITVDVYGHLVPGANRQAVNRLPSLGGFQALKQKEMQG